MLEHGGRIHQAAQMYGIPVSQWLDLSTGINPHSWSVPEIPQSIWARLPESEDELEEAAQKYYASELLLPVAGVQAAIQALPKLRPTCQVGLTAPSYAEHYHAWSQQGHEVRSLHYHELPEASQVLDVIVLCNPNNPTGTILTKPELLNLYKRLVSRNGWLLVDESFIEATPELSIVSEIGDEGMIVLRSLGKFFGLPGARVGFVFAWRELLSSLNERLGPWTVNGPGRWVASQALTDWHWQKDMRNWLPLQSSRLAELLARFGFTVGGGTPFFQWLLDDRAQELHEFLARQAILTRLFREPPSVRFGLPATEADWSRLTAGLEAFCKNTHWPAESSASATPVTSVAPESARSESSQASSL